MTTITIPAPYVGAIMPMTACPAVVPKWVHGGGDN